MTGRSPSGRAGRPADQAATRLGDTATIPSAAFTPGPWQRKNDYDGALTIIGNVDGESFSDGTTSYSYDFIANCENEYGEPASPANVQLILAAPDLYAALAELVETLRREAPGTALNNHRFDGLGIKANAALAKARGQ